MNYRYSRYSRHSRLHMFEHFDLDETIQQMEPTLIGKVEFVLTTKNKRESKGFTRLEDAVNKYKVKNVDDCVRRAIGNAIRHGELPINVQMYFGPASKMLVVVKDNGKGFDHQTMVDNFKAGKKYYDHHGRGTKTYNKSKYGKVCWHDAGKTISVLFN